MWFKRVVYTFISLVLLIALNFAVGYFKSLRMRIPIVGTTKLEDALDTLKTGDLLFMRAPSRTSLMQMRFCGAPVNHCAMFYRAHDRNLWLLDIDPRVGAVMIPLRQFLHNNWTELGLQSSPLGVHIPYMIPHTTSEADASLYIRTPLYVRRLVKPLDERRVLRFLQDNIGRPYSYRWWPAALFSFAFAIHFPFADWFSHDDPGMFCSELLVHLYDYVGVLQHKKRGLKPSMTLPYHFWLNELPWKDGQGLMDAEQLIGLEQDMRIHENTLKSTEDRSSEKTQDIGTQDRAPHVTQEIITQDRASHVTQDHIWLEGVRTDKMVDLHARNLVNSLLWNSEK